MSEEKSRCCTDALDLFSIIEMMLFFLLLVVFLFVPSNGILLLVVILTFVFPGLNMLYTDMLEKNENFKCPSSGVQFIFGGLELVIIVVLIKMVIEHMVFFGV